MGFEVHATFERSEEWRAAHADEVEFTEIARTLKSLAGECGQDPVAAIDALARFGLGSALAIIAEGGRAHATADFYRRRMTPPAA